LASEPRQRDLEHIELELLLEAVFRRYGFDFRDYARASLKRRIWNVIRAEGLNSISGLLEKVLHDQACMERLLLALSVNVTSMFRDPGFYLAFREKVVPLLRTYPFVRIWHAGCATGEEAYSMAILLTEEGLYEKCRIYATDMNEVVLAKAEAGIYPLGSMQEYTRNYIRAGGSRSFSEYYTAKYGSAIVPDSLKRNIVFAHHNLATDASFNEFNVILCRNVMIYFSKALQDRVHNLLYDSLVRFGILGIGQKEGFRFTPHEREYEVLIDGQKLYRRVA
jgi:chemotaxis protein methyltransferase CheR